MSVIIEGLTLPKHNPKEIDKNVLIGYAIVKEDNTAELCLEGVHYLIKMLPTPHGRLIDADDVSSDAMCSHCVEEYCRNNCECFIENVQTILSNELITPTIIEAEVSE